MKGIHAGRGMWVLSRVGTLFVLVAYLTLAAAIVGMLVAACRTLRHRRASGATERYPTDPRHG